MAYNGNDVAGYNESGSSGTSIEIKIKTMDSQTYTLQVDKQMPVPALKERIASVTGVVTEHQRLICRGKVLKDDQLLSAYHVEDGHTLHLVVREPNASSSGSLPADSAPDPSANGNRGQFYQVAPGIVVETFNMPGQGDRALPDVRRIISAVLGSIGIANSGNNNETNGIRDNVGRPGETPTMDGMADATRTQPEQSGMRSSNDRSRLHNAFGIPAGLSFGSLQSPVIPDALATLSQYLSNMRQEFTDSGRTNETGGGTPPQGNEGRSSSLAQSEAPEGLPSPASLAVLLSGTRQMLGQQVEECLLQLVRQLENQVNMTDQAERATAQSGALRNGNLLQNLGAYFLELGRTVMTLRYGVSPAEAVVNTGPAVFISSSGPNPLMVQPLPFQPGASFGTPLSGMLPSNSGSINGIGGGEGFVPRRIDIQIRRVGQSTHQTEPAGSQQSSDQRNPTTNINGEEPVNQSSNGTTAVPSSNNGPAVRVLPFRSMMTAVPDLNRSPQDASGNSLGILYPVLGRYSSIPSGNLGSRTGNQVSDEHPSSGVPSQPQTSPESAAVQQNSEDPAANGRVPTSSPGQRESVSSRTIDINVLSAGAVQNDQNSEGQIPPGIFQFLRGLFPGGEFHVESVSSQGTGTGSATEQERTSSVVPQEAGPAATEEGLFLSRMLQQIMPLISQTSGSDHNGGYTRGDTSQQGDGSAASTSAENNEVRASRREADENPGPNPKRQKRE